MLNQYNNMQSTKQNVIQAEWCIYVTVNENTIGSDNGW